MLKVKVVMDIQSWMFVMVCHGCHGSVMDVRLGCKFASNVSIFVHFSISNLFFSLCDSRVTTFLVLTHCLHYCLASFNYGDSRARDLGPTC